MKKQFRILKDTFGCDFVVSLDSLTSEDDVKILQITDPQIMDSSQMRYPERLSADKILAWAPENFDTQCGNHIRSLIAQTIPDLIFITGDIVYGEFDDNGTSLQRFVNFMDSFGIPWAPVFGNHDNESQIGVAAQCAMFENAEYCLFKRGSVSGNSNYTVGISVGGELIRVLHLLDSNGCRHSTEDCVVKTKGMKDDQLELIDKTTESICLANGKNIPAFLGFHIPHNIFIEAELEKGYVTPERYNYIIGVDVEARDGDFGFKLDSADGFDTSVDMLDFTKKNYIDAIFIGHHHNTSTIINYKHLKLVYGLKTGQYDSYIPGNIGGTLITLRNGKYAVYNVSSCCKYGAVPENAKKYEDFFLKV